jgi:hypothetical protein
MPAVRPKTGIEVEVTQNVARWRIGDYATTHRRSLPRRHPEAVINSAMEKAIEMTAEYLKVR